VNTYRMTIERIPGVFVAVGLVYIEGRLQSRQWQATDGSTRRSVEIVANRLQALSSKSTSEAPAA